MKNKEYILKEICSCFSDKYKNLDFSYNLEREEIIAKFSAETKEWFVFSCVTKRMRFIDNENYYNLILEAGEVGKDIESYYLLLDSYIETL